MFLPRLNSRPFTEVCSGTFGRKVIYSLYETVTPGNVVRAIGNALPKHFANRQEIDYLDNYYRGVQPILFRERKTATDVNNKVVVNHAYEIVEFKVAQNFGEPVQYVRKSLDEGKSEDINAMNEMLMAESKSEVDIEIGRWRSICGTAYRMTEMDSDPDDIGDAPFRISALDPRSTFVAYSQVNGKPVYSCTQLKDEDDENIYVVFTRKLRMVVKNGSVIETSINGLGEIPIIEYPNNARRLSDIEVVITLCDAISKISSDRTNANEQFVMAIMKFINCEVDDDLLNLIRERGAVSIKSTVPGVAGDVEIMGVELNQDQAQTFVDDLYDNILTIVGMPSREQNVAGDTGQAVYLRNGWDFAEQRAEIQQPIFEKSERQFLRIILGILKTKKMANLKLSDIEIKVVRSKTDNMTVKANVLGLLLQQGIDPQIAIKTCNLWSDPEEVFLKSKEVLDMKYKFNPENGLSITDSNTGNVATSIQRTYNPSSTDKITANELNDI